MNKKQRIAVLYVVLVLCIGEAAATLVMGDTPPEGLYVVLGMIVTAILRSDKGKNGQDEEDDE